MLTILEIIGIALLLSSVPALFPTRKIQNMNRLKYSWKELGEKHDKRINAEQRFLSIWGSEKKNVLKGINAAFERGVVYTIVEQSREQENPPSPFPDFRAGCTNRRWYILCGDVSLKKSTGINTARKKNVGVVFQSYNLLTTLRRYRTLFVHAHQANPPKR